MEEINQYLIIFPNLEELQAKCKHGDIIKQIQGIFLVKENDCQLELQNQKLSFEDGTFGKPIIIENYEINYNKTQLPKISIELNSITELKPINKFDDSNYNTINQIEVDDINYPILALYIIIIISAIIAILIYLKKKFYKPSINFKDKKEDIELQTRNSTPRSALQLPDDAHF